MRRDILLLDNNAVSKLSGQRSQSVLRANMRATGRQFWPTAINILEAVKAGNPRTRTRLLRTLRDLAGDNHALMHPSDALHVLATTISEGRNDIDISEPRLAEVLDDPESVTDDQVAAVRQDLEERETGFRSAHERGKDVLRDSLIRAGGAKRWPTVGAFLDDFWTDESHMAAYVKAAWADWRLVDSPIWAEFMAHPAWRLYFEGWGAAVYTLSIAHPQPPWVESADFEQLVYMGFARTAIFVSDDKGLQTVGNALLRCRHEMKTVVSVESVTV